LFLIYLYKPEPYKLQSCEECHDKDDPGKLCIEKVFKPYAVFFIFKAFRDIVYPVRDGKCLPCYLNLRGGNFFKKLFKGFYQVEYISIKQVLFRFRSEIILDGHASVINILPGLFSFSEVLGGLLIRLIFKKPSYQLRPRVFRGFFIFRFIRGQKHP